MDFVQILSLLLISTCRNYADEISDQTACLSAMIGNADCVSDSGKQGFIIKPFSDCLTTQQKICQLSKGEFCAQQHSSTESMKNAVPLCRTLPESCIRACKGPAAPSGSDIIPAGSRPIPGGRGGGQIVPPGGSNNVPAGSQPIFGGGGSGGGMFPVKPFCPDNFQLCRFWASIGECDKNPIFMHVWCKAACNRC